MTCDQAQELLLTDYIDGQSTAEAASQLAEHVLSCSSCRQLQQSVVRVNGMVAQAPQGPVPFQIWEKVRETIEAPAAGWAPALFWKPAVIFSVTILVLGGVLLTSLQLRMTPLSSDEILLSAAFLPSEEESGSSSDVSGSGTVVEYFFS